MDHVMIFTYIVSHIAPRSHMLSMGSRVVEGSSVEARIFITTTCSNMISREFLNDKIRETSGTSPVHLCKSWCKRSWLELDQRVLECTSVSVVPNSCVHSKESEFLNDKFRETSGTGPVHLCRSWCTKSWLELNQRVLECASVSVFPNSCVHSKESEFLHDKIR